MKDLRASHRNPRTFSVKSSESFYDPPTSPVHQNLIMTKPKKNVVTIVGTTGVGKSQNLLFKNKTIEKEEKEKLKPLTSQQQELLDGPVDAIFKALTDVDPVISEKFHPKDTRKLRRALEIYYTRPETKGDVSRVEKLDELEDSLAKVYGQVIGYKEFQPLTGGQTDVKLFEEGGENEDTNKAVCKKYQVKWIKKLLGWSSNKESSVFLQIRRENVFTDATDLSQWATTVSTRGLAITEQFIKNGPLGVTEASAREFEVHSPNFGILEEFNSNKTIKAVNNWKHHECPVCKDSEGKPLVAVGEDNWLIHVKKAGAIRNSSATTRRSYEKKHEELVLKYKR
ncbi:hypothetical protein JCM33374_g4678 [Metschnikowia sp. JCM 33374]|nr:hypothetical protein JCM33374_g4678 [Metschnikowia sp. JCM 33374]